MMSESQGAVPEVMPLVRSGYSLKPDMMFGWQPKNKNQSGAPIPLYYDYEQLYTDHLA